MGLLTAKGQTRNVRVLLADDHQVVRDGLARLLQGRLGIEVVGQAVDGMQAVEMALQLEPDVILMDVNMPRLNGIEATRYIRNRLPRVRIVGLSALAEQEIATAMTFAGAADYLPKTAPVVDLISTIRRATA
jgi:DNA-binding NarL/FixJ family response regulator